MMLYVNGQDIERLVLGVICDAAWEVAPVTFAAAPEGYLAAIDAFLREQGRDRRQVTTLVVVRGPGSATSLRSSLALANAWAFAQSIELVGVEKCRDEDDDVILSQVAHAHTAPLLTPLYEQPAKITASTKDALGR
ncbi:MAG: hypothetical protein UY72_C0067G0007 [Candidatus Uhrbacteria bacterium GW2011_GWD2_52_7]|uniref:Gcp-like domain-containing protein n=1 Tax=Candidatus Uhrbacteria bacterium GW2011_GWD2_52_7 TaxID=1618989 RepID=A0A0G1XB96_9BACT|nr:MAG: hypothetical protein UY72_C0067G0007 [Candidatus Uhrbacteria bacterium GW2011_GWD2_52_7]